MKGGNQKEYDIKSKNEFISNYKSFNDFVQKGGLAKANLMQLHFLDQNSFIDQRVKHIGKIENFEFESLSLDRVFKNSVASVLFDDSSYFNYTSSYQGNSADIVGDIYKEDIRRFNYTF